MTLDCRVGHRRQARLGKDPQRVLLAGRLNQSGGNELAEDLVSTIESVQPHRLPSRLQGLQEHSHPVGGDRCHAPRPSRFLRRRTCVVLAVQARQVEAELAGVEPLPGDLLEHRQLSVIMGRANVLDAARPPFREECTICTARAPDAVLTVRTYGLIPPR